MHPTMDDGNNAWKEKESKHELNRTYNLIDIEKHPVIVSALAALVVTGIVLALFAMGTFSPVPLLLTFIVSFVTVLAIFFAGRIKSNVVSVVAYIGIATLFVVGFLVFWR